MIRVATEADAGELLELSRRFLSSTIYGTLMLTTDAQLEQLIRVVMHLGVIFVAEAGTLTEGEGGLTVGPPRLVGMIGLVALDHPITGSRYADEIAWFVVPEWRNGSVGPRLLAQAEGWARENRLYMVKMSAPAGSTVGAFYEKLGYRAVETAYQKVID